MSRSSPSPSTYKKRTWSSASIVRSGSAVKGTPSRTIALRTTDGGSTTSETAMPTSGAWAGSVV